MRPFSIDDCLNNWTPEQLAVDASRSGDGRPVRYLAHARRLPLAASCWWWIVKRRWMRHETFFEPIYPNDPRYESAPYEAAVMRRR